MKKILLITIAIVSLSILSCNNEKEVLVDANQTIDFEKFSLSVENNTLVFDSEEDFQGCIDYLEEIGEDNLNDFENAIGYKSYRSTGKELPGFEDEILKTLINPEMENVICGYLIKSDFINETAVVYDLRNSVQCDLDNLNRNDLEQIDFTFDDEFFEFVKTGVKYKSAMGYCNERIQTASERFLARPGVSTSEIFVDAYIYYNRTLYYKYLELEFMVESGVGCYAIGANYDVSDSYWQNRKEKRSIVESGYEAMGRKYGETFTMYSKPYRSTRRLDSYKYKALFTLIYENYSGYHYKHYTIDNYCVK